MTTTDHPLTEARADEKAMASLPPQHIVFAKDDEWIEEDLNYRERLLALVEFTANWVRTATPFDPHHDARPWQDCTRKGVCAGDLVEARAYEHLRIGVAGRQYENGDWYTEGGHLLTDDRWPLRRIPAPTPPAEEVELPAEFGAVITDVEADLGETVRLDRMVWTGRRWAYKYHSATAGFITSCTLPDGTRARRDGDRADGTPRFVEVQKGEK